MPLEVVRARVYDVSDIEGQYKRYRAIYNKYSILKTNRQNIDESSFRISITRGQYILTKEPRKAIFLPSNENRESLTVIEGVSARGITVPAILIAIGKIY